jgi:hypothetical protein
MFHHREVPNSVRQRFLFASVVVASCLIAGCGSDVRRVGGITRASANSVPIPARKTPFRFFAPTSFWNKEVPADAVLDPTSAASIAWLNALIANPDSGPNINTVDYSVPIYTVSRSQPTVRVKLEGGKATSLQSAWNAVPLPPNAHPASGTDGHLVVWQPSTDRLWEFWRLAHGPKGWKAVWGGAMQGVSSNPGVYGPEAWPGARTSWGGDASSLSLAGGLITLEDLADGQINHALALAIPDVRAGVYASPARRDDGISTDPLALPEGAHLRLDPKLNLAALHLSKLTLMIAEAAQRYGIFIRSRGSTVINFYAQDPTPTGTDPYIGPEGYLEGKSSVQAVANFPWSHLQLLTMRLHRNDTYEPRNRRRLDDH